MTRGVLATDGFTRPTAATVVEGVRAGFGLWHLTRAQRPGSGQPGLDRVLGARQLAQAALVLRGTRTAGTRSGNAHTLSATVDTLHAASMVPLALLNGRRRGFALEQVWIAVGLAVAEIVLVGRGGRR